MPYRSLEQPASRPLRHDLAGPTRSFRFAESLASAGEASCPADPHSYEALRVGLGVLAMLMYAPLLPLLALHLSDAGWLSVAAERQLPERCSFI